MINQEHSPDDAVVAALAVSLEATGLCEQPPAAPQPDLPTHDNLPEPLPKGAAVPAVTSAADTLAAATSAAPDGTTPIGGQPTLSEPRADEPGKQCGNPAEELARLRAEAASTRCKVPPLKPLTARDCTVCRRPQRVCLCSALPQARLHTRGRVIVLQHPFEIRKRLATVPLLTLSLAHITVLRVRHLSPGCSDVLDEALEDAANGVSPLYLLFPGAGAVDVAELAASEAHIQRLQSVQEQSGGEGSGTRRRWPYTLLAIDGTWNQAKEMFKAFAPRLLPPNGPVIRVQLMPASVGIPDELDCLIKREPLENCRTTLEAIARALALLERDPGGLLPQLLAPLKLMTDLQAQFDPAVRSRLAGDTATKGPLHHSQRRYGFFDPNAKLDQAMRTQRHTSRRKQGLPSTQPEREPNAHGAE
ncbi:hypothetical protein WJX72_003154 [[Myrmecia] bisecta]|uniref:tRNA-uridine aminocarboxypropyltransferase n=1 Tax=[Myrmecia] bisecta TaxID=41462 RepID=A0AAW1QA89_9CHLO